MREFGLYYQLISSDENGHLLDFRPSNLSFEQLKDRILRARENSMCAKPYVVYAPCVDFTNRVVMLGEEDDVGWKEKGNGNLPDLTFIRTNEPIDGGIVEGDKQAIAFFIGDCPTIVLRQNNRLSFLYGGFRNLVRRDKEEPNIVEVALKYFNPAKVVVWVGHGIGPCCWVPEYGDKPEILDPVKSRDPGILKHAIHKTTSKSPYGAGHLTVDLYDLVQSLLLKARVNRKNIVIDSRCTCCAEEHGRLLYWSHTRFKSGGQKVDGRNMSVVTLNGRL